MSELSDRLRSLGETMSGSSGGYLCCECADENDRLQAIVDRLPRDAEGNPIFPLDVRYRKSGFRVVIWKIGVEYVFGSDGSVHEPKSLYGSPEAAEKARAGK